MTLNEFYETKLLTGYCKKCIMEEDDSIYRDMVELAPNVHEFKEMLKSACAVNNKVMLSKVTAEVLKDDWHFLRDFLGYKSKRIVCNSSMLKVGNSSFSVMIPNGRNNPLTRYAFLSKDEVNTGCFIHFGLVSGRFFIYDNESEDDSKVVEVANGSYEVFYKFGMIIFVS